MASKSFVETYQITLTGVLFAVLALFEFGLGVYNYKIMCFEQQDMSQFLNNPYWGFLILIVGPGMLAGHQFLFGIFGDLIVWKLGLIWYIPFALFYGYMVYETAKSGTLELRDLFDIEITLMMTICFVSYPIQVFFCNKDR